jgi:hypothetical protein
VTDSLKVTVQVTLDALVGFVSVRLIDETVGGVESAALKCAYASATFPPPEPGMHGVGDPEIVVPESVVLVPLVHLSNALLLVVVVAAER